MTILEIQRLLLDKVRQTAAEKLVVELDQIAVEVPPKTALGDLAFPVAFELAKRIKQATGEKRNPRDIAELLKTEILSLPAVARVEVAGAGYLNVFLDRSAFLAENAVARPIAGALDDSAPKVCVEHTSVNPNKAAHVGHVRNSVLGDTFQRILKATGKRVEVQNYIDNTGVQVADVVVGFIYLENKDLDAIHKLDVELEEFGIGFDYYCWDLYTKAGKAYEANDELKQKRTEVLHQIGYSLSVSAITKDEAFIEQIQSFPEIERLNIGPVSTMKISWDQPHEGNMFEFLYRRRSIERAW